MLNWLKRLWCACFHRNHYRTYSYTSNSRRVVAENFWENDDGSGSYDRISFHRSASTTLCNCCNREIDHTHTRSIFDVERVEVSAELVARAKLVAESEDPEEFLSQMVCWKHKYPLFQITEYREIFNVNDRCKACKPEVEDDKKL